MISVDFLLAPFVACLLIVVINVYFGIHVIKREIIFIDIALAQIAALGSTVGLLLRTSYSAGGPDGDESGLAYLFSLLFISIASAVFTVLKSRKIRVPLEALIGVAYAVATTLTVIILDKAAGGDVHVHDMLIGSIMWVSWGEVIRLGIIVVAAGGFHLIFRRRFISLTDSFGDASRNMRRPALWDFLFYFSFGIVVVEAVHVAGILTVFAFLILPASLSAIVARGWTAKLLIGWAMGVVASFLGLWFSVKWDVPSSPVIIVLLGVILLVSFTLFKARRLTRSS